MYSYHATLSFSRPPVSFISNTATHVRGCALIRLRQSLASPLFHLTWKPITHGMSQPGERRGALL